MILVRREGLLCMSENHGVANITIIFVLSWAGMMDRILEKERKQ